MCLYIYTYYNIFTEITITPTSINPPCHHQEIAGLILDSFNGLPSCRLLEDQMFQFFWKARNDFVLRKIQEKKLRWNNSQSLAVVSGCKTILCCGQMMHYFTRLDQGGFSEISQVPSPLINILDNKNTFLTSRRFMPPYDEFNQAPKWRHPSNIETVFGSMGISGS